MSRIRVFIVLVCAAFSLGADECGGCEGDEDVTGPAPCNLPGLQDSDGGIQECQSDLQCSDGVFCNGIERCVGRAGAPASSCGCVRAETLSPCLDTQVCHEDTNTCTLANCAGREGDVDGDGHTRLACGGDDCDDADPLRYPGRAEVCDAADHDEDCDPMTFGTRDSDGDAHVDDACCNVDASSVRRCGNDCNDTLAGVHPGNPEVCNNIDDDCDAATDEAVKHTYYQDGDADGYGTTVTTTACMTPTGYSPLSGDCDDTKAGIVPGTFRCDPNKANEVALCMMGVFSAAFCPGTETCHPQPNGTGICY